MQHVELDYTDPVHQGFFDAIQELLGAEVNPNFKLLRVNSTTIKIAAGVGDAETSIAVKGRYRYRTTETTAALPGGLPDGEHPIFVTATDNDFTGPLGDIDEKTDYNFGLQIKKAGETPATALYREVGKVVVASGSITALKQTAGSVSGAQIEDGALSGEGDINWNREPGGALKGDLKGNSVGSNEIAPDAVGNSELGPEAATDIEVAAANKDGAAGTPAMRTLGTGSKQAAAGNDARLSDQRTPLDESVTARKLPAALKGGVEDGKVRFFGPVVEVWRGTNQAIPNKAWTPVLLPEERVDTDGSHSGSEAMLVAVVAGYYYAGGTFDLESNATGVRVARIVKGLKGASEPSESLAEILVPGQTKVEEGAAGNAMNVASRPFYLDIGDWVRMDVFQNSGGPLNVMGDAVHKAEFGMIWVRPR